MKVTSLITLTTAISVVLVIQSDAANILLVFPMAAFSHYNLGNKLLHALAAHGHNVTMIGAFRDKKLPASCREVYLEGLLEEFEVLKKDMFGKIVNGNLLHRILMLFNFGTNFSRKTFSHPEVQKFLKDPNQKFDVVVVEEFMNQAMKAFAYHFDAPLVAFSTIGASSWVNSLVGNPAPWSYVPDILMAGVDRMNMWQRIVNALVDFLKGLQTDYYIIPNMNALIDEFFPGAPHVEELNNNISIILLNSHVSTNKPVPLLPNMIEIGGYHVDPPKKLPKELQNYLDGCKNGFVYFSMGSNFQSKYLANETLDGIMKAFAKLKKDVLWKFEDDQLPGKPDNVKIVKWLPQQDILAHPNIKLFITHGGLLSTIETIYHGVPVIAIPAFGDQKANAANAVNAGYAVKLDLSDLSEETLSAALNEALINPKYAENARQRSKLMHDRETKPQDAAVYWIEYAIRHRGEKHYRSAALDLAWYELYMVDAATFIVCVILVLTYLFCKIVKYIIRSRKEKRQKKEKQT